MPRGMDQISATQLQAIAVQSAVLHLAEPPGTSPATATTATASGTGAVAAAVSGGRTSGDVVDISPEGRRRYEASLARRPSEEPDPAA
jgi:hypothetical protein